jgi:hypothetical protein
VQKENMKEKTKQRWTRHQESLELGDKRESRNYRLSFLWIRHKIRVISIFIIFYLDFNLISIQPTQDRKYLFRLGLRFIGLRIALDKSYSNSYKHGLLYICSDGRNSLLSGS